MLIFFKYVVEYAISMLIYEDCMLEVRAQNFLHKVACCINSCKS